ncbi:hypothetical protein MKW98_021555 [Papaver atlanticum]|uniref:Uncharacterized protein n=1 Tax=Papaver atlanticum TaxID=357466 RepID=A0AAD4TDL4_9MAGN|nr:hypothetical protein MKW98_021555 [Papaver atlanticum]
MMETVVCCCCTSLRKKLQFNIQDKPKLPSVWERRNLSTTRSYAFFDHVTPKTGELWLCSRSVLQPVRLLWFK